MPARQLRGLGGSRYNSGSVLGVELRARGLLPLAGFIFFTGFIFWPEPTWADRLGDAIAATPRGWLTGHIDGRAVPGFLGIHGAPSVDLLLAFLWTVWVGWVFSTVGAFG